MRAEIYYNRTYPKNPKDQKEKDKKALKDHEEEGYLFNTQVKNDIDNVCLTVDSESEEKNSFFDDLNSSMMRGSGVIGQNKNKKASEVTCFEYSRNLTVKSGLLTLHTNSNENDILGLVSNMTNQPITFHMKYFKKPVKSSITAVDNFSTTDKSKGDSQSIKKPLSLSKKINDSKGQLNQLKLIESSQTQTPTLNQNQNQNQNQKQNQNQSQSQSQNQSQSQSHSKNDEIFFSDIERRKNINDIIKKITNPSSAASNNIIPVNSSRQNLKLNITKIVKHETPNILFKLNNDKRQSSLEKGLKQSLEIIDINYIKKINNNNNNNDSNSRALLSKSPHIAPPNSGRNNNLHFNVNSNVNSNNSNNVQKIDFKALKLKSNTNSGSNIKFANFLVNKEKIEKLSKNYSVGTLNKYHHKSSRSQQYGVLDVKPDNIYFEDISSAKLSRIKSNENFNELNANANANASNKDLINNNINPIKQNISIKNYLNNSKKLAFASGISDDSNRVLSYITNVKSTTNVESKFKFNENASNKIFNRQNNDNNNQLVYKIGNGGGLSTTSNNNTQAKAIGSSHGSANSRFKPSYGVLADRLEEKPLKVNNNEIQLNNYVTKQSKSKQILIQNTNEIYKKIKNNK
jgi:hypothetical protein